MLDIDLKTILYLVFNLNSGRYDDSEVLHYASQTRSSYTEIEPISRKLNLNFIFAKNEDAKN